jgi:hypothetical protein
MDDPSVIFFEISGISDFLIEILSQRVWDVTNSKNPKILKIKVLKVGRVDIIFLINYENANSQNSMSKFKLFDPQSILENFEAWAQYKAKLQNLISFQRLKLAMGNPNRFEGQNFAKQYRQRA